MRPNRQWWFTWIWILAMGLCAFAGKINGEQAYGQTDPMISPPPNLSAAPENPAEMTDIHDIKPPEILGFNPAYAVYGLLALFISAAVIAGWLYWKKRRGRKLHESMEILLPPEEIALNAMDQLLKDGFEDGRVFYFELSAILRNYIRARYAVNAPEMTSEELLPLIENLSVDPKSRQNLRELIRSADPVKFAAHSVLESKMAGDIKFVRQFVIQTTPAEQEI